MESTVDLSPSCTRISHDEGPWFMEERVTYVTPPLGVVHAGRANVTQPRLDVLEGVVSL
jgi:hypothetical protein